CPRRHGAAHAHLGLGGVSMRVNCVVNGEPRQADNVWEGESLLFVLRERLGLPGAKNACEQGECGSCTVYLDGTAVCACLVAAGAVQCGFCTPGLIVAVDDLLARDPHPTEPDIREALAGNLCRCTGYENIVAAVKLAAARSGCRRSRCGPGPAPSRTRRRSRS